MLPSTLEAIAATRVAREAGHLKVALRAIEHAYRHLDEDPAARNGLAEESGRLGSALAERGGHLVALSQALRGTFLGDAGSGRLVIRLVQAYERWRPKPEAVWGRRGKDALYAAATGTFWVGLREQGRVLVVGGGITTEGTEAYGRVLDMSSNDVEWLLIDMRELTYVGSTALAVMVKAAERLRERGGGLCLFSMSSSMQILVEMLGVEKMLHPQEDLSQALGYVVKAKG